MARCLVAALFATALTIPAVAGAASTSRYDFCVMQEGSALAPVCAHSFVISSSDSGGIRAGFRDHRVPAAGEQYEVCVRRSRTVGNCVSARYRKRVVNGRLGWDLPNLAICTMGPGHYIARWYLKPRRGAPQLIGSWRFSASGRTGC